MEQVGNMLLIGRDFLINGFPVDSFQWYRCLSFVMGSLVAAENGIC